jgi:tRNA threonylcarbamoyladenosine biosynthesis protein TsaE
MGNSVVRTNKETETRAVAAAVASLLLPGDVLLLQGDLGAGKTTFVQGLAEALGVDDAITSPTFTLLHICPTAQGFDLVHADLYRLDSPEEIADLGLAEMLDAGSVAAVEWGGKAASLLGDDCLVVDISAPYAGEPELRQIAFTACGARWGERTGELVEALGQASSRRP